MEKPSSPSAPKHMDNEPMTLTYKEFEKALKGALEVVSTHNREEAEIFLAGLKPVGSAVNAKLDSMANTDDNANDNNEADNIVKKP